MMRIPLERWREGKEESLFFSTSSHIPRLNKMPENKTIDKYFQVQNGIIDSDDQRMVEVILQQF